MRRYIVLLLITGIVWAQTDFDTLVLKDGTTYLGEYSKTEGKIVFFKPQEAFGFQPVPVKLIQTLKLKDGRVLLHNGIIKKNKHTLALEEYQKLNTKEKAIYDAKSKNLDKWALYGSISPIIISVYNEVTYWVGGPRISIAFSAAIVTISSYFVLNHQEIFNFPKSILTDSEKEIYEQAYSKKLKQRKIKYAVGSFIVAGVIVAVAGASWEMSGFDMGPQPPGPY